MDLVRDLGQEIGWNGVTITHDSRWKDHPDVDGRKTDGTQR